jgi:hypothetical protein
VKRIALTLTLLLAGCGNGQSAQPQSLTGQARLDAISDKCGVARSTLRLQGDEMAIRPDPNESYERIDCVLNEIKNARPPLPYKFGFEGNERFGPETK